MGDNSAPDDNSANANGRPFLIVGLGNPGSQYEKTNHNLGFEVVDWLAREVKAGPPKEKFKAIFHEWDLPERKVLLIKPQTYMNLSGESVGAFVRFFKCLPEKDIVVISDDLDLPPGKLRLRLSGGAGGHNGLKSIICVLGGEGFARLRMGIGRHPSIPGDKYVLMKIAKGDKALYEAATQKAGEALKIAAVSGFAKAMDFCNRQDDDEEKK